jgi:acetoin utilization deacetylase AcuC-like enzyme
MGSGENLGKTGLVFDEIFLRHRTTPGHPECPERLLAIRDSLRAAGIWDKLELIPVRPAERELVELVHESPYIDRVAALAAKGGGYLDSPDTPISADSFHVALCAVGGLIEAAERILAGSIDNAFAAVRPPGHHALPDHAMGFCLFNNVAIVARYLQRQHGLERILIVDWDVHHGNGTQAIFYDDPNVLYFSIHQYPFYPGTGSRQERGWGDGLGFTINAPVPAGTDEQTWLSAFREHLLPVLEHFPPDFVLISAGFDAHELDLLGRLGVTTEGYAEATRIVKEIADRFAGGRLLSALEGGYHLGALGASVAAHVAVLLNAPTAVREQGKEGSE